jgi:hypothetical protein
LSIAWKYSKDKQKAGTSRNRVSSCLFHLIDYPERSLRKRRQLLVIFINLLLISLTASSEK